MSNIAAVWAKTMRGAWWLWGEVNAKLCVLSAHICARVKSIFGVYVGGISNAQSSIPQLNDGTNCEKQDEPTEKTLSRV